MGCGGSRLGGAAGARAGEGSVVPLPEGIRPLLRRRLEEMKKRSHASVLKGSQTQSKKELLRHGSSEDGEEAEEKDDSLKLSAKVAPAPDHHVEEKKEVIYEKVSSDNDVKDGVEVVKKQDEKIDDVISTKKEGNDDGRDVDIIIPQKDGEDKRKSMETESVIIEPKEQNEGIVKKEKRVRKGKGKGKRFGMALPRKYLANVTAPCYAGRGCMGNNPNTRVVQEKSSQ
ncbi:unnamed protein product [Eruca vesicaria subsp. sativa]|uniref:Uncharacterized protein n=1 Tax=Eruca vesicaria subsp. sativa TaxID=29727 RepID=A0ABC8LKI0_ERUVS|nr:unnamed protein product [Eruca vesicaria subsp. sativa]